jgi:hypothetical protein
MHTLFPSQEGFMPSCRISPPWKFLLSASRNSLQGYELSRLSHASNLRKEITALVDQWVEENSSAMLARWLMENLERERTAVETTETVPPAAAAPPTGSDRERRDYFARICAAFSCHTGTCFR